MPLYEIAVISAPSKKELEDGVTEKLIFGPKAIVAANDQAAVFGVIQGEDAIKGIDFSKIKVLVRPFA